MSSISTLSGTSYQSPLQRLQDELRSEVGAGTINSSDKSALSSALTDIDSQLRSGSAQSSTGTQGSPGDFKSKLDDLIQGEVSSGKLTSDQATELQNLFKSTFGQGPGGAGGPPPDSAGHAQASSDPSSSSTDASSGSGSVSDLLQQFLQSLQAALSSTSSSTSYSATGSSSTSSDPGSSLSALLIDYRA
jgi:hypothetical protein